MEEQSIFRHYFSGIYGLLIAEQKSNARYLYFDRFQLRFFDFVLLAGLER